ncbi:lipoxygenase family protein [Kamptonema formosum]|uniref:lipoxygenase family protein n=1 Tax=Kamptonema formosum TaxID=331992 RepID=UPI00034DE434|nr:lipoxygenase family protein [Oscillatoria sp. PCC 10802]
MRSFKTKAGREYKERLELPDDQNHVLKYSLVEAKPSALNLKSIMTTVEMSAKSQTETIVHWSAELDVGQVFAGQIVIAQEKAYKEAIAFLDAHFNPSFGKLEVELSSGSNLIRPSLFSPDPYAVIDLDDSKPQKSKARFNTLNPLWDQNFTFDVVNPAGKLRLSVWDANLGRDDFMGHAEVNLQELKSGEKIRKQLKLQGVEHGEIVVSLLLELEAEEKLSATQKMQQKLKEGLPVLLQVLEDIKNQVVLVTQQQALGGDQKYEYQKYPRRKDSPDLPLEDFPHMVKGLPSGQALPPEKLGLFAKRMAEYVYSEVGLRQQLEKIVQDGGDPWTAYYAKWIPSPVQIPQIWKDDVEFCRQLIQGVNPMYITLCTDASAIPQEMLNLTAQGKSIQELIAENRLFMVDYGDLEDIPQLDGKVFYAPYLLVYRELLDGGKSRLNMVGIQLTRHKDRKNEVYTPNSPYPNKYLLAKIHTACADDQLHQFVVHLGMTHLVVEPFVISHHNAFPKDHPIGILLKPHLQETIGINYLARQTLIAKEVPFTDKTFATGTAGGLQLFWKAWKKWDFFGMSFPQQLLARGFDEQGSDGVEDFFFREDGYKIWNALTEYVGNVVAAVYKDDAAVAADKAIQDWAAETADPERAAVPGFPAKIETRDLLVNSLTNIIFLASAHHSAINFSQYQYLGYVPNRPNVLFKGVPETEGDITLEYILSALANFPDGHFQVFFSNLLSTPSLHPLSDLPENHLFPEIHAAFIGKLNDIAAEIEERNKKLEQEGKIPYPYLSPKQIASSIDT